MYNTLFYENDSIHNNFTPEAVERSVFTNTHGRLLDNNTYIAMKYGLYYSLTKTRAKTHTHTHKLHTTYLYIIYTVRVVGPGGNLYFAFQSGSWFGILHIHNTGIYDIKATSPCTLYTCILYILHIHIHSIYNIHNTY